MSYPHDVDPRAALLAAKDAEIAALTEQRDDAQEGYTRWHKTAVDRFEQVAALRAALREMLMCSGLMDDDGPGVPTDRLVDSREAARAALEMSGGVK